MSSTKCPECGNYKKPWFPKCYDCIKKEKKKPTCNVCSEEVPEGHTLCKKHWLEAQDSKKKIRQTEYVKKQKEKEIKEIEELKKKKQKEVNDRYYRFNYDNNVFKSKSEFILYLVLSKNFKSVIYEAGNLCLPENYEPDFVIDDEDNNTLIIEHFGMKHKKYAETKEQKKLKYDELCKQDKKTFFIYTEEKDICNIRKALSEKLKNTPFNKVLWK